MGDGVLGHFIIETEGVLTTKGCGRSDSVIAGDIADDCSDGRGSPPAPVIGPQRGSANVFHTEQNQINGPKTGTVRTCITITLLTSGLFNKEVSGRPCKKRQIMDSRARLRGIPFLRPGDGAVAWKSGAVTVQ